MPSKRQLTIYRVTNHGKAIFTFKTCQEIEITITPGSTVDLFSFEIEKSSIFQKSLHEKTIKIVCQQTIQTDNEYAQNLQNNITLYREPHQATTFQKNTKTTSTKKPPDKSLTANKKKVTKTTKSKEVKK